VFYFSPGVPEAGTDVHEKAVSPGSEMVDAAEVSPRASIFRSRTLHHQRPSHPQDQRKRVGGGRVQRTEKKLLRQ